MLDVISKKDVSSFINESAVYTSEFANTNTHRLIRLFKDVLFLSYQFLNQNIVKL